MIMIIPTVQGVFLVISNIHAIGAGMIATLALNVPFCGLFYKRFFALLNIPFVRSRPIFEGLLKLNMNDS